MATAGETGETFGQLLRRYRRAAALSQPELAMRAGLSVEAVSTLERGRRTQPRPETVVLLATALGLSAQERAALIAAVHPGSGVATSPAEGSAYYNPAVVPEPDTALAVEPLPVALTGFIGRETDLVALRDRLLERRTRMLTLTGPGGCGKTRLALEVARLVEATFADGVVFVALAPLTAPDLVLPAIVQALGLREPPERSPLDTLRVALRDKQILLVLDNCEQVAVAAPQIAALVALDAGVRVLATSRMRLAIAGERVYPVEPLDVPSQADTANLAVLGQVEAVRLFVARAQDALPTFVLTHGNAPAVAAICVKLDGLPLAIELAAARSRHLPPAALLKRLDSSLALLTGGPHNLPPRQQSLRETVAWSYALLDEPARALLRCLSVFVGGCTVEAVEAVCHGSADPLLRGDMQGRLFALAEQSLLAVAEGPEGEPRFRMLETVREFGREQLEAMGELEDTRRRHASYYLALAEEANLYRAEPVLWSDRLEHEPDNLRAAWDWTVVLAQKTGGQAIERVSAVAGLL